MLLDRVSLLVLGWFRRICDSENVYSRDGYNCEAIVTTITLYSVAGTLPGALHALAHEAVPITQELFLTFTEKMRFKEWSNLLRTTQLINGAEIQTPICLTPGPEPLYYIAPSDVIFHTHILGTQIWHKAQMRKASISLLSPTCVRVSPPLCSAWLPWPCWPTVCRSELTQGGPAKGRLHGVAVQDSHPPHHNSSCSFFALLDLKITTVKRELKRNPNPLLIIDWQM